MRAWQGVVLDLVREQSASKRATARLASLGVNGAGLTVMLAVFAHTGGLTGAEVVVAGGTSALSQKVLEAIFGIRRCGRSRRRPARTFARVERLLRRTPRASMRSSTRPLRGGQLRPAPRRGGRNPSGRMKGNLDARLAALGEAADLAEGRLDDEAVERGRAVVAQAGERLGFGLESTVVALAGPTGAGKSRCSTRSPGGARGGRPPPADDVGGAGSRVGDGADPLLDWLEIPRRHRLAPDGLDGLVLIDLPDFDSVETRTGSRSTASSAALTSSPGSSSRRSTPMRPSTTATCARSPRTGRRWRSS